MAVMVKRQEAKAQQTLLKDEQRKELVAGLRTDIRKNIPGTGFEGRKLEEVLLKNADEGTLFMLCKGLRRRFVEELCENLRLVGEQAKPGFYIIAAVCAEKEITDDLLKPLFIIAGLEGLKDKLEELQPIQRKAQAESIAPEVISGLVADFKADPDGVGALLLRIARHNRKERAKLAAKPEDALKKEFEQACDQIVEGVYGFLNKDARLVFNGEFKEQTFKPALAKLDKSVLDDFLKYDSTHKLSKLYSRLHGACLNAGGFGGPATIIKTVAEDAEIPTPQKFNAIVLSLYDLYTEIMNTPGDPQKRRVMAGDAKLAASLVEQWKGGYEAETASKLEQGAEQLNDRMLVRSHINSKMEVKENKMTFFNDLSLRILIPALKTLDPGVVKQLTDEASGSVGAKYVQYHAKMLDKGGFEVPGELIWHISNLPAGIQALAMASVFKTVSEIPSESKEPGLNEVYKRECRDVGLSKISEIEREIAKGDLKAAQEKLKKEISFQF